MWMDNCGGWAIAMLAYHTMPYMYSDKETQKSMPGLFLIKQKDRDAYEWFYLDSQLTLEDYCM